MGMQFALDIESLLTRQGRAKLPLARQLLIYLDPFSLFKDAARGTRQQQERALSYNRARSWMLLAYLRRWLLIAVALFLCIAPTQALAAREAIFVVPAAALAVGCCMAITVVACTITAYLLLRSPGSD